MPYIQAQIDALATPGQTNPKYTQEQVDALAKISSKTDVVAKPTSTLDDIIGGAKQLGAGATDMLLSSPKSEGLGKLVPNAVNGLMALPGQLEHLITGTEHLRNPAAEERFNAGVEQSNELLNTHTPDNFAEGINRIAGGALLSVPKVPNVAGLPKIADEAIRTIIPGISEPTVARVAGAIAVPTAINEGITEAAQVPDNQYFSIYDAIKQTWVDDVAQQHANEESFWDSTGGKVAKGFLGGTALLGLGGVAASRSIKSKNKLLTENSVKFGNNPTTLGEPTVEQYKATGHGFTTDPISTTTPSEGLKTAMFDANASIIDKVRKLDIDSKDVDELNAFIDRNTRIGRRATTEEFYRTGKLVDSNVELTLPDNTKYTPDAMFRGYEKLPPEQRDILRKALVAGDALDSRKLGVSYAVDNNLPLSVSSKGTVEGTKPSATKLNSDELIELQDQLDENPHLRQFVDMYRGTTKAVLKAQREAGVISKDQYYNLLRTRSNFIPNIAPEGELLNKTKILESFDDFKPEMNAERFVEEQNLQLLKGRTLEEGRGVQEFVDPFTALDKYTQLNLNYIGKKKALNEVIDTIERNGYTTEHIGLNEVSPEVVTNGKYDPSKVVVAYSEGKPRVFEVLDPQFRASLQFQPRMTGGFANKVLFDLPRRIQQANITGSLRPAFAPYAMMYDTVGGIQAKRGMKSASLTGLAGDPTTILSTIAGIPRQVASRMQIEASTAIMSDLYAQQGLFSKLPESATRPLAESMYSGYMKSALHRLRYNATFHASQIYDAERELISVINSNGANTVAGQLARSYMSIMTSIHEAARYSAGKANLDREIPDSLVAWNVKQAAGDFSKKGLGDVKPIYKLPENRLQDWTTYFAEVGSRMAKVDSFATQSIPYYNVGKVALGAQVKAIKENPLRTATAVSLGIVAPTIISTYTMLNNPELRDKYLNDERRTTHFIAPHPTKPGEVIAIPYPIEYAAFAGGAQSFMESLMTSKDPDVVATIQAGLAKLNPVTLPTTAQAGLAGYGVQAPFGGRYSGGDIQQIPKEQISGLNEDIFLGSELPPVLQDIIYSVMGINGRAILESEAAYQRADNGKGLDAVISSLGLTAKQEANRASFGFIKKPLESASNSDTLRYYKKLDTINTMVDVFNNATVGRTHTNVPSVTNPAFMQAAGQLQVISQSSTVKDLNLAQKFFKARIEDIDNNPNKTDKMIEQRNKMQKTRQNIIRLLANQYDSVEKQLGVELEDLDPYKTSK